MNTSSDHHTQLKPTSAQCFRERQAPASSGRWHLTKPRTETGYLSYQDKETARWHNKDQGLLVSSNQHKTGSWMWWQKANSGHLNTDCFSSWETLCVPWKACWDRAFDHKIKFAFYTGNGNQKDNSVLNFQDNWCKTRRENQLIMLNIFFYLTFI